MLSKMKSRMKNAENVHFNKSSLASPELLEPSTTFKLSDCLLKMAENNSEQETPT